MAARRRFLPVTRAICLNGLLALGIVALPASATARGLDFLDNLAKAGRRHVDLDAPPVERAAALFERIPEPQGTRTVYVGRDGAWNFQLVTSDGKVLKVDKPDALPLSLEKLRGATGDDTRIELFIAEPEYFLLRKVLLEGEVDGSASIVMRNGEIAPLRKLDGPKGPELSIEVRPGLLFPGYDGDSLGSLMKVFDESFDAHDSRVLSLFDEGDISIRGALDDVAGELHVDLAGLSGADIATRVARYKRKIIIMVGHVEGADFVVRRPDGTVGARIAISELDAIADRADSSLILLGCETARISPSGGLSAPIRDIEIAENLKAALKARDYGSFYSAIGSGGAPLVIRPASLVKQDTIFDARRLREKREVGTFTVAVSAAGLAGRAPAAVTELRTRWLPFLPTFVHKLYIAGIFAALFFIRTLWREWRAIWPIAPATAGGRVSGPIGVRLGRLVTFALVMPIFGMATLLVLPFSILAWIMPFVPWWVGYQLLRYVYTGPFYLLRRLRSDSAARLEADGA